MKSTTSISVSILSADFARLGEQCVSAVKGKADRIHLDIMDNHFVNNLTFGPYVYTCLYEYLKDRNCIVPLDIHLMTYKVIDILNLLKFFMKCKDSHLCKPPDIIFFHPEAIDDKDPLEIKNVLQKISQMQSKAGIVLNCIQKDIEKEIIDLKNILNFNKDKIDSVLVMGVNPGFGGQKISDKTDKILGRLCLLKKELGINFSISVDGGVNEGNICSLHKCGADTFVVGSAIFKDKEEHGLQSSDEEDIIRRRISKLRKALSLRI